MLFKNSIRFPNIFNYTVGNTDIDSEYTSINRCIALILTTAKGELLGDPDFGCTLYEQLFNHYTEDYIDSIKQNITEDLNKFEKRINIFSNDIDIIKVDDTRYNIKLKYTVKNSALTDSITIPINRNEY